MNELPPLTIPELPLPIELIPEMIHPAIVHFVIAIPVLLVLIELFNSLFRKRALSVTSLLLIVLLVVISFGAYLTGGIDGKLAFDTLSSDAKMELAEHKQIGIYLVYGSSLLLVFKILSMATKAIFLRILFVLILLGFTAGSLYQGKEGGELVYKHGANVQAIVSLDEQVSDLQDDMDDLKSKSVKTIKLLEANITSLKESIGDTKVLDEANAKVEQGLISLKTLTSELEATKDAQSKAEAMVATLQKEIELMKDTQSTSATELQSVQDELTKTKNLLSQTTEEVSTTETTDGNTTK
jgi:uncharacterized membrane protein